MERSSPLGLVKPEGKDIGQTSVGDVNQAKRLHIPRKPLPLRAVGEAQAIDSKQELARPSKYSQDVPDGLTKHFQTLSLENVAPVLPPPPSPFVDSQPLSIDTGITRSGTYKTATTESSFSASTSTTDTVLSPSSTLSTASSYTQKAYREVRHFAGGLIHHPSQSTKHFSILRHSHGLVFYQGPATSIAISIFADAPLPADRTIWLQSKGWTGKAGMRARALAGWNGKWLDVTPLTSINVDQLNPSDERAWQRDIASFIRRAEKYVRANHKLRETAIIRIPVEAGDGYYRLMLCADAKKKVLCPSPVFRVLSTSARPSSIRGASLSTLPLEIGARVLTSTAKASAKTSIGNAVAPITSTVQAQIQPYTPSWETRMAARAAYDLSGASSKVKSSIRNASLLYDQKQDEAFTENVYEDLREDGPSAPFPISFIGSVDFGSRVAEDFDIPINCLSAVPEDILRRLDGYYFGWVRNNREIINEKSGVVERGSQWHKAIISAIPHYQAGLSPTSASEKSKSIAIYLIQDNEEPMILDTQVKIQVMGFIRPPDEQAEKLDADEVQAEAAVISAINDIEVAQAFLDQPAWAPESSIKERESRNSRAIEKIKASYVDSRVAVQHRLARIPLHRAGIRLPTDRFREDAVARGGVYVRR